MKVAIPMMAKAILSQRPDELVPEFCDKVSLFILFFSVTLSLDVVVLSLSIKHRVLILVPIHVLRKRDKIGKILFENSIFCFSSRTIILSFERNESPGFCLCLLPFKRI